MWGAKRGLHSTHGTLSEKQTRRLPTTHSLRRVALRRLCTAAYPPHPPHPPTAEAAPRPAVLLLVLHPCAVLPRLPGEPAGGGRLCGDGVHGQAMGRGLATDSTRLRCWWCLPSRSSLSSLSDGNGPNAPGVGRGCMCWSFAKSFFLKSMSINNINQIISLISIVILSQAVTLLPY